MSSNAPTTIINSDRIDGEAILVEFGDGTSATFTTEELSALRPNRAPIPEDAEPDAHAAAPQS